MGQSCAIWLVLVSNFSIVRLSSKYSQGSIYLLMVVAATHQKTNIYELAGDWIPPLTSVLRFPSKGKSNILPPRSHTDNPFLEETPEGNQIIEHLIPLLTQLSREYPLSMPTPFCPQERMSLNLPDVINFTDLALSDRFFGCIAKK